MKLTQFAQLKGHRVFHDFTWPKALCDFARFNLIYGWNGSGKTTLSNLFRAIELETDVTEGDVKFTINGTTVRGAEIAGHPALPQVKVFNPDFVKESVFKTGELLAPIFYVGKANIEKQQMIEALKSELNTSTADRVAHRNDMPKADRALEEFYASKAKLIKEALRSAGRNIYNTYDRRMFITTADDLLKLDEEARQQKRLTEEQREVLRAKKDAKQKKPLSQPRLDLPDFEKAVDSVSGLMRRTVISATIAELADDPRTAEWVKAGLSLHMDADGHAPRCRFCNQPLSDERVRMLEGHFNDQYEKLLGDLAGAEAMLAGFERGIDSTGLPDKAALCEHLASGYEVATGRLREESRKVREGASVLQRAVVDKRAAPFQSIDIAPYLALFALPDRGIMGEARSEILKLLEVHNTESNDFEASQKTARRALEEDYVAETLAELVTLRASVDALKATDKKLSDKIDELSENIRSLEVDSTGHELPAKELNAELASYLGRRDLQFENKGKGYAVTRAGVVAKNLSEGEITAVAFLYFLKSLKDKDFDLANGIVVIDDPISSLDANAIFSAFGFMRERIRGVGQLFVLTHNFTFFRQVKNWLHFMNQDLEQDKHKARMYMLTACNETGCRTALLEELDPLLRKHDTEYNYLFKLVAIKSMEGKARKLEDNYGAPNVARRLLESFLSFRFPAKAGKLRQQLGMVKDFDAGIRARIIRFVHTYSHDGRVAEPEHDLSVLAETPAVMREILRLIQFEDSKHYKEMTSVIKFDPLAGETTDGAEVAPSSR
ncbi:AAA family ATPase [Nitratidesulfovibrio vulgaris]|uniref:AAA family ATPase n=1 Tax=Nitratidesulfovibrio vulgaris TaxID=881 RepID=UPI0023013F3D|nr:AAA family ATPase [Nitratidesulfovibrio vulgaris]WCB47058.1 AAA family ATPase [Nitratidesulfovibrio vulgaris]